MGKDFKPAFYAIIPADVRYDTGIKPNAKLLYGEITALCNEKGYCWAENEYFAKLYGVNLKTISVWISQLVEKNYLERQMVYKPGTKEIDSRILRLPMPYHLSMKNEIPLSIEKRIPSPENNGEGKTTQNTDVTNEKGNQTLSMKKRIPLHEKMEDNNTYEYIVFNTEVLNREKQKTKNFIIPSVEDVDNYCKERKNGINAQNFHDFYSSKGWYIGKNKMRDWKAAVRTWEQSNKRNKSSSKNCSLQELQQKGMDII